MGLGFAILVDAEAVKVGDQETDLWWEGDWESSAA